MTPEKREAAQARQWVEMWANHAPRIPPVTCAWLMGAIALREASERPEITFNQVDGFTFLVNDRREVVAPGFTAGVQFVWWVLDTGGVLPFFDISKQAICNRITSARQWAALHAPELVPVFAAIHVRDGAAVYEPPANLPRVNTA